MDMILEHWLSAGAGVFLIGMVLYGHYRGALKQCVSLGALILTIVLVKIATPYMTDFIKDNPSIRQSAAEAILNAAGWEEPSAESTELPAAQRIAIENLNLPQSVKETLLENNNSEFIICWEWTSLLNMSAHIWPTFSSMQLVPSSCLQWSIF